MIYANENDKTTAHWLSCVPLQIDTIDDRSITDVRGQDLDGYTQCHFFAGIGGWPYALQLAGWPRHVPVWTGSCPCQPFSVCGKQTGVDDERHLWPAWFRLIQHCKPPIIFGEQSASAAVVGLVSGDRPASTGGADVWFDGVSSDLEGEGYTVGATVLGAHSVGAPHPRQRLYWCAYTNGERLSIPKQSARLGTSRPWAEGFAIKQLRMAPNETGRPKSVRVKPGIPVLVDGFPGRLDQTRGLGNAIVPQVAAEFITASMEAIAEQTQ